MGVGEIIRNGQQRDRIWVEIMERRGLLRKGMKWKGKRKREGAREDERNKNKG